MSEVKNKNKIVGCVGCGVCVNNEPEIFGYNQSGLIEIKNQEKFNDFDMNGADWQCPVQAIKKN